MLSRESHPLYQLLQSLVEIPSEYPNELAITQFLLTHLQEQNFGKIEVQPIAPGRSNLLITRGSGNHAILFYGHVDTVQAVSEWTQPPFHLEPDGDRLHGLGAYDMKGGTAAFLTAVGESDTYTKIILAVDEENLSQGAWHAAQQTPEFFSDVELAISAEPNFGLGLHGITTGRTGRVVYDITAHGTSAHLARQQDGVDAIAKLTTFLSRFYEHRGKLFSSERSTAIVRKLDGESAGMSVCALAQAQVDVLLTQPDTLTGVLEKLQAISEDVTCTPHPRPTPFLPPYEFNSFPYKDVIASIVHESVGRPVEWKQRTSVADDNVIASLGIPVLTWGPDGGNAHAGDEWVSWESLLTLYEMYAKLLQRVRT